MEKRTLKKPDGRMQILYSLRKISDDISAPSPQPHTQKLNGYLRYNPFLKEWTIYAAHRQNRTFLPPAEYNPLAPTTDASYPTEVPAGDYDVTVFENLFPSLGLTGEPDRLIVPTDKALGTAEVVVYTQNPKASLGELPLEQIELIIEVWADRYKELGERKDVEYVYCFENRGQEVGVTLNHPHGQIYAYPFIPPIPARELSSQKEYFEQTGHNLLDDHIQNEIKEDKRILYLGEYAVAFMPVFARYAYEVWVAPLRPAPSLYHLTKNERFDLAKALKTVLLKFDHLWNRPFPYIMAWHQAPTDKKDHPEAHVHAEFFPPYRMMDRLKYLAGSEMGAGVFTADTFPEEKVKELQNVKVEL
jgi:UDPglucose--hexose-1-phosphate uridylyltransferase